MLLLILLIGLIIIIVVSILTKIVLIDILLCILYWRTPTCCVCFHVGLVIFHPLLLDSLSVFVVQFWYPFNKNCLQTFECKDLKCAGKASTHTAGLLKACHCPYRPPTEIVVPVCAYTWGSHGTIPIYVCVFVFLSLLLMQTKTVQRRSLPCLL